LDAETLKVVVSIGGLVVGVVGLWHTVVILPLRNQMKLNNESIRNLEIDSAKLDSTLSALTKAIDRLTDRLDS
jgi:hypothetical protein